MNLNNMHLNMWKVNFRPNCRGSYHTGSCIRLWNHLHKKK